MKTLRCLVSVWQPLIVDVFSEFVNMEKIDHVIQYFDLKGLSSTNIKTKRNSTLKESVPSFTSVKYLVAQFKRSHMSFQNEHHNGQPNEVTIPETMNKIQKMVLNDRGLKVCELSAMVEISKSAIHRILTVNMYMRKLCVRWVPHLLIMEQKQCREDVSVFGDVSLQ